MPLQTARLEPLLLNNEHMNQSKFIADGINQKSMHAVTATIANSININLQSIFKQYTKRQQPMNTVSTTNDRNIKAQSINKQCVLHQQSMRIAPDSLMPGFSSPNTFTLSNMPPIPVILRGAEGEVAESILLESTLSGCVG